MMRDSYYVIAHFEWVLMLTLVSVCLVALLSLIRARSTNARLHRLASLSMRIWAVGLTLTLATTFATRFVRFETMVEKPWVIQWLNATVTAGTFLMVLAMALTGATLLWAFWTMIAPRSE